MTLEDREIIEYDTIQTYRRGVTYNRPRKYVLIIFDEAHVGSRNVHLFRDRALVGIVPSIQWQRFVTSFETAA